MATFDPAYRVVLKHEGGFTDDPDDPGGATRFGLSLRHVKEFGLEADFDHDLDVDVDDLKGMTEGQARAWYRTHWWDRYHYELLENQELATKVFDLAVNNGPGPAHRILQYAIRACEHGVKVDGVMGPETIAEANRVTMVDPQGLLREIRALAVRRYLEIVKARPLAEKYLHGWIRRACA